jgi:serine protease Do
MNPMSLRASIRRRWLVALATALAIAGARAATELPAAEQIAALERAQAAVVGVRATAVDEAGSIATLGRDRLGSGVVIGPDGLVLTIGYLILEADHVDLVVDGDRVVPARVQAYDLASGFGLLQPLAPLRTAPAILGRSATLAAGDALVVASGGRAPALGLVRLVSRRPFSGYWEYHLDDALFTAPARDDHSGAALFSVAGELMGIGSLRVSNALGGTVVPMAGNMFVPVDLLRPILGELRERGTSRSSTRAWLGLTSVEHDGTVRVLRVGRDSPAERAGLRQGDVIERLDGREVTDLESLYKALWQGSVEREVTLDIRRGARPLTVLARSVDRMKTLQRPQGI